MPLLNLVARNTGIEGIRVPQSGWIHEPGAGKVNTVNEELIRDTIHRTHRWQKLQAVVLGDHYDTAYMEDIYETGKGGSGARLSANGADDNYSVTSTLLQAAPLFLKLLKEGRLERDIWLLHLTGEEFPSDCMGARNFCHIQRQGHRPFGN